MKQHACSALWALGLLLGACTTLLGACTTPPSGGDLGAADAAVDLAGRVPKQHRAAKSACPMTRPPGPDVGGGRGTCTKDGDCTDPRQGSNGRCVFTRAGATCSYDTCFEDSACGGKVCLCRAAGETVASAQTNHCLSQGNCQTDGDCGGGGYCSPSFGQCGTYLGVVAYYCHTPLDECVDDEDCQQGDAGANGYCMFNPASARWSCAYSVCAG